MSFDNPTFVSWRHLHYVYLVHCQIYCFFCITIFSQIYCFFCECIVTLYLSTVAPTDTIFVRVYESRMDLLRAVIIGAEGTPYHDGLFFFDVFFPSNYPNVPPVSFFILKWDCYIDLLVNYLILLVTESPLPFWWPSNKSEFVQLWKSMPEPSQYLEWSRPGEMDFWGFNHVTSFGLNSRFDTECQALF